MPRTVIVLGCYRSGTSLVAGILHKLGVNMGCLAARIDWNVPSWLNPAGYFEDPGFHHINRTLIGNGYLPRCGFSTSPSPHELQRFRSRFERKLSMISDDSWGWKDPRTIFTIEYYLPFLQNPMFVLCKRNRSDILSSLITTQWVPASEAEHIVDVCLSRLRSLAGIISNFPTLTLPYESTLSEPRGSVEMLRDFVGMNSSPAQVQAARALVNQHPRLNFAARDIVPYSMIQLPIEIVWDLRRGLEFGDSRESALAVAHRLPKDLRTLISALRKRDMVG